MVLQATCSVCSAKDEEVRIAMDKTIPFTVALIGNNFNINGGFRAALDAEGWSWFETTSPALFLAGPIAQYTLIALLTPAMSSATGHLIQKLSTTHGLPVVVFSPDLRLSEICEILNAGAEDVISVPFFTTEVVARLRAVARVRFGM